MGSFFENLSEMQKGLSNLSLTAHERGFRKLSDDLNNFSTKIERLNSDMQIYFHDNERILRDLTGE